MKRAIHWFRRDLRVADNTALTAAMRQAETVFPLFILDDRLLAAPDMGGARLTFLLDSLRDLDRNLKALGYSLTLRRGQAVEEVTRFCRETRAEAVFANRNYEPPCQQRDQRVENQLNALGVGFLLFKDAVVWEEREILTQAGAPYTVFTPYAKAWRARAARLAANPSPAANRGRERFPSAPIPATSAEWGFPPRPNIPPGGETEGARRLREFLPEGLLKYGEQRDFPALDGTARLSPHLHFGTVGIRAIFEGVARAIRAASPGQRKNAEGFVNELIWREFYLQILVNFPQVLDGCFRAEYNALAWSANQAHFQAWCAGQTGYPFIDAAMRCLNATGWMHNRPRMAVSMFLTKDLLLPWQWGERYFMQTLVDGDHAANNGGWQWSAGTGTDAAPYFRIFNPTAQGERFDPEGTFVRQWVPELAPFAGKAIHRPWEQPAWARKYPPRIVDHATQRVACLAMFQAARSGGTRAKPLNGP